LSTSVVSATAADTVASPTVDGEPLRSRTPADGEMPCDHFSAPLVKQPFPPTHYPGVENREDATIIHVGGGFQKPGRGFRGTR